MSATAIPRVRSSIDGIRAAVGAVLVACGLALTNVFDSTLLGIAVDTSANTDRLPGWSRDLAGSVLASVIIVGTVVIVIRALVTTRYRRFALYAIGIASAAALSALLGRLAYSMIDDAVQRAFAIDVPVFRLAGTDGRLNPADPLLAAAVATVTIAASFLAAATIRRAAALVALYAFVSIVTIAAPPLTLLTDVGVGLLVGSLLLWAVGRHDLALRPPEIIRAVEDMGYHVVQLEPCGGVAGADWLATPQDGDRFVVTAYSRDDKSSALATRAVRWIRLRKTGDHRPFLSLRRSVEHQALVALQARARGVTTPEVRGVAPAGVDGMVLARDRIDDAVPGASAMSACTLRSIWGEAERLQCVRIAHGRLRLDSFLVDAGGRPWLLGFDRGELAATDQRLGTDLAELLASTAVEIGSDDAVRMAHGVVGTETLQRAIPWLQPLALTAATRDAIGGADEIQELRDLTGAVCDAEPEEPVRLERIDGKTLFVLGTVVLSAWFLFPQLADLDSLWSQTRGASWEWALTAAAFSMLTYLAATGSLLGAIPVRLAYWPAATAQIASSFANRVTPAKVGGFATNLRYFQRNGVPVAVAATAVGLNAIAGVIMHAVLTLCALLLASGDGRSSGVSVPSPGMLLLIVGAMAVTVVTALAIPSTRRVFSARVLPQLRSGWGALRIIMHDPVRLMLLFGGSAMITLCYLAAMYASLQAFGSTAPLPLVALLFLTGSVVANAAPTPGGLGAAEAALIAALSTIEETAIVVPAVFLYRLVTFWLPILPGWAALTYLRRTDRL